MMYSKQKQDKTNLAIEGEIEMIEGNRFLDQLVQSGEYVNFYGIHGDAVKLGSVVFHFYGSNSYGLQSFVYDTKYPCRNRKANELLSFSSVPLYKLQVKKSSTGYDFFDENNKERLSVHYFTYDGGFFIDFSPESVSSENVMDLLLEQESKQ